MTLLICRAGVAIGEAVLTPAAISIVADLFPAKKRALPISIYGAVATVMATGAFGFGAAALKLAAIVSPHDPSPWKLMFVLLGLPGLLLSILMLFTVSEPLREGVGTNVSSDHASARRLVAFIVREWRLFLPYLIGTGVWTLCSGSMMAWFPTLMTRAYSVDAASAGFLFGAISVPFALAGTFFWPWLSATVDRRGHSKGPIISFIASVLLGTPMFALAAMAPSLPVLLGAIGLVNFALGSATVLPPLAMQAYGPSRMRGRLMAMVLLSKSVIGMSGGPVLVAVIATHWPGNLHALGYAMVIVGLTAGLLTTLFLALSLRGVRPELLREAGAS
jgi:MFS family permease